MECVVAFPIEHYVVLAHDGSLLLRFGRPAGSLRRRCVELESNDLSYSCKMVWGYMFVKTSAVVP